MKNNFFLYDNINFYMTIFFWNPDQLRKYDDFTRTTPTLSPPCLEVHDFYVKRFPLYFYFSLGTHDFHAERLPHLFPCLGTHDFSHAKQKLTKPEWKVVK